MDESREVLIEQTNSYGSMHAVLEDDGRTVYLYLFPVQNPSDMVALWVANRLPAPDAPDRDAMMRGEPPLMPCEYCKHPEGSSPFESEWLSLVWFEEGDGLALFYRDSLLAVMPGWAGVGGFCGYSRDAAAQHELAWPLEGEALENMSRRVDDAKAHWTWRVEEDSWSSIRDSRLEFLERRLGPHGRYWAVDGGSYPPLAIALFQPPAYPGIAVYATIGMSAQPMPKVEMYHGDPAPFRRIECAIATVGEQDWAPRLLSSTAGFPWKNITWIGSGHTLENGPERPGGEPLVSLFASEPPPHGQRALFSRSKRDMPDLTGLVDSSGDPVTFLWAMTISSRERDMAREMGSEALLDDLRRQGRGWVNRGPGQ